MLFVKFEFEHRDGKEGGIQMTYIESTCASS